jgi:hypothetical protein
MPSLAVAMAWGNYPGLDWAIAQIGIPSFRGATVGSEPGMTVKSWLFRALGYN